MEASVIFIEFYIKHKYKMKLSDYFDISQPVSSIYRKNGVPPKRKYEFITKEGSLNPFELIKKISDIGINDVIELYVKETYNQRLNAYYNVSRAVSASYVRDYIPEHRINEFSDRENIQNVSIDNILNKIYNNT